MEGKNEEGTATNRVTIVTDSAANLPDELVRQYAIHVLPLKIIWRGQVLRDGIDLSGEAFYRRLAEDNYTPTTSAVSTGEFLKTFRHLRETHDAVVTILLARELSASYGSAVIAQQMMGDPNVQVIDGRTATMAQGFVVLEAARTAQSGAPVGEVAARAQTIISRVHVLGIVETLEYLRRTGRIGAAAAFLGSVLQFKPIIGIPPGNGTVVGLERPRTWKQAIARMLDLVAERVGDRPLHVAVGHGGRPQAARALNNELLHRFDVREHYITHFTPVLGAHAGPVLSVSFYAD